MPQKRRKRWGDSCLTSANGTAKMETTEKSKNAFHDITIRLFTRRLLPYESEECTRELNSRIERLCFWQT